MNTFKKSILFLLTLLLSISFSLVANAVEPVEVDDYKLCINSNAVALDEEAPTIITDGRTLLPLQFLFDIINEDGTGTVEWDETAKQITMTYRETVVKLWIGNGQAEVNGVELPIDGAAPMIYKGSTYVPLRFVTEAFDMAVNWDGASHAAYIMDNKMVDEILSIWEGANKVSDDMPAISTDVIASISVDMDVNGVSSAMEMKMNGKIEQDYAKKFQHMIMETEMDGNTITIETYDDGEAMYMVADGEVVKTVSAISISESILSQYDVTAGLGIGRESYTSLKLTEEDKNYVISGNMILPEDSYTDILSNMESLGDLTSALSGMTIKISRPIGYKLVADKETGLLVSMDMKFAMEMGMTVENENYIINMEYEIQIPNFQTGAVFDTTVPDEIVKSAISI